MIEKKTEGYIINDDKLIPLRNVSVCEMNGVPILAKECTNHLSPRIGGFTEKFSSSREDRLNNPVVVI